MSNRTTNATKNKQKTCYIPIRLTLIRRLNSKYVNLWPVRLASCASINNVSSAYFSLKLKCFLHDEKEKKKNRLSHRLKVECTQRQRCWQIVKSNSVRQASSSIFSFHIIIYHFDWWQGIDSIDIDRERDFINNQLHIMYAIHENQVLLENIRSDFHSTIRLCAFRLCIFQMKKEI